MTNEEKAVAILDQLGQTWGILDLIQVEDALKSKDGQGGEMEPAQ